MVTTRILSNAQLFIDQIANDRDALSSVRTVFDILDSRRIPYPSRLLSVFYIKYQKNDVGVGNESFLAKFIIPKNGCFIDVGAWLGGWALFVAQKGFEVYAFEPSPIAVTILKEKAKSYPNFHLYPFALGEEDSVKTLRVRTSSLMGIINEDNSASHYGKPVQIIVRKLDNLNIPNIEVIKIDTEGFEVPVLTGAKQTIQKYRPRLVIEVHKKTGQALNDYGLESKRIQKILERMNYTWKSFFRPITASEMQPFLIAESKK
jgi:FkbM family methyltransferase